MDECNSTKHDFRETPNIYLNISNDQQFRLNKINEINLLQRLERERTNERKF